MSPNDPPDDKRDTDETIHALRRSLDSESTGGLEAKLRSTLRDFREDLKNHPYARKLGRRRSKLPLGRLFDTVNATSIGRWAGAGLVGSILIIVAALFVLVPTAPTWAQVSERFRSVEHFSATIYARPDAMTSPAQFELWTGSGGRVRMKAGSQIIFARSGKVERTFDIETRAESEPDRMAASILRDLAGAESFSLETVIERFSGKLTESTPVINPDVQISEDLIVFDIAHESTTEWVRVWALRESRLPVQIRGWSPADGESIDVFLSYTREPPDSFFDPEEFAQKLRDRAIGDIALAYEGLTDPTGNRFAPGIASASRVLEVVTTTIDGETWTPAQHLGKVVLVNFYYAIGNGGLDLEWIKKEHAKFGGRDDFVLVGVAVDADSPDRLRQFIRDNEVPGIQLHEPGKKMNHSLARAFGIDRPEAWIIHRDGSIEKTFEDHPALEAAVVGLNYRTRHTITSGLMGKTREELKDLFRREPDAVNRVGDREDLYRVGVREVWEFHLINDEETAAYDIKLRFDENGICMGMRSGDRLIDPATLTVVIGEAFWAEYVGPKIDPHGILKNKEKYGISLSAQRGLTGHPLHSAADEIVPGREYTRQLKPGTYEIKAIIREKGSVSFGGPPQVSFNNVQDRRLRSPMLTLMTGITLGPGEVKTVRIER